MRKVPVEKKDENGNPVLAVDKKKISEIKSGLKTVTGDLQYAEENDAALPFKRRLRVLKAEYDAILNAKSAETEELRRAPVEDKEKRAQALKEINEKYNVQLNDLGERVNAVVTAQKHALRLVKLRYAGKEGEILSAAVKQAEESAKAAQVNLDDIVQGEITLALFKRKEKLERDLEYYKSTPVQLYDYKHIPKEVIDKKVKWAAEILGVTELLDIKPKAMSGGQRQRIALGRAIVREPKVMLLDEPLSNLDAKLRTTMRSEIVKLHNDLKTTFIYVTHDQIEAMTMGTRIVVMKLGVIQQIDSPTNLFDYPENKFVAGFIGTPQMNFFDVTVKKSGSKLAVKFANGETQSYSLANMRTIKEEYLDGKEHCVTLGIRGENISLDEKGLTAKLSIKEILGNTPQMFVKITPDSADSIVCVSDRNEFRQGDRVKILLDERRIHLFDKATE
ncbi:MAG: ABC transporter ATP-binding protein, partial [Clostridia bacterium]|nr:ABC transporter ATP-binding protein [Clostridia bacterium]